MSDRYGNIKTLKNREGRRYFTNPIYPDIPLSEDDIYIFSSGGDRYDVLAKEFYGDPTLWWIIASANPTTKRDSLIPQLGIQLRIPANKDQIISLYESLNRER